MSANTVDTERAENETRDRYLQRISQAIAEAFRCDRVSITRVHPDRRQFTYVTVDGVATPDTAAGASYTMALPVWELFSRHDTLLDSNAFFELAGVVDPLKSLMRVGIKSMIRTPLTVDGQVIGSVAVFWLHVSHPTPEYAKRLTALATKISDELANVPESFATTEVPETEGDTNDDPADISAIEPDHESTLQLVHELKTPLTCILAFIGLVIKSDVVPEPQISQLTTAMNNASRMHRLVQLILDNSRLGMADIDKTFTLVDIGSLVYDVMHDMQPIIHKQSQIVNIHIEGQGCVVKCDYSIMSSILNNILTNASQYSSTGSEINVLVESVGDLGVVTVTDHGVGISSEQLQHIKEPFFRGSDSVSSTGHGLGLAFVNAAVEKHNGTIGIDSIEGEGTTIRLEIPLHLDEQQQAAAD